MVDQSDEMGSGLVSEAAEYLGKGVEIAGETAGVVGGPIGMVTTFGGNVLGGTIEATGHGAQAVVDLVTGHPIDALAQAGQAAYDFVGGFVGGSIDAAQAAIPLLGATNVMEHFGDDEVKPTAISDGARESGVIAK